MTTHGSATVRRETPDANQTTRTTTIINALKRRAQAVLNDKSVDPDSRAIIRYALETNDPWLAELVRRVDAGDALIDTLDFSQTSINSEDGSIHEHNSIDEFDSIDGLDSVDDKAEALVDLICRAGDEPATKSAALLVLMSMLENARHPKAVVNNLKHLAFTCCGELNVYGIVDAQIAVVEGQLLSALS